MSVREVLVDDLLELASEELLRLEADMTLQNQLQIIRSWAEIYEDVPPRNKAENLLCDALEAAENRLVNRIKAVPQIV